MRIILVYFLIACVFSQSKDVRHWKGVSRRKSRADEGCAARAQNVNSSIPYRFTGSECCNDQLELLLKFAVGKSVAKKLGDVARKIQKLIQKEMGASFEMMLSNSEFAVSSHYSGQKSCKLKIGDKYLLVYETPVQYDIEDSAKEEFFSLFDSDEPFGSSRPPGVRGPFPNIKDFPNAGGDLSIQEPPSIRLKALTIPTLGSNITIGPPPFDENAEPERYLHTILSRSAYKDKFPKNTHCDHMKKDGNKCCDFDMYEVMRDVVSDLSVSPEFGPEKAGVVAERIKLLGQRRYDQSLEIVVSTGDFAVATHHFGEQVCKYKGEHFTLMAYVTPDQYDSQDEELEKFFSELSIVEPLGTTNYTLPGMRLPVPIKEINQRDRSHFPDGSHCDKGVRQGNKCCDFDIYEVMREVVADLASSSQFGADKVGVVAERIKQVGQSRLAQTLEIIVSRGDFSIASHLSGNQICKFQDNGLFYLAYATPNQYDPENEEEEEFFSEVSNHEPLGTSNDTLKGMREPAAVVETDHRNRSLFPEGSHCSDGVNKGNRCCDFDVYEVMRDVLADLSESPKYGSDKAGVVAERIKHVGQERLAQSLEIIVSKGDFAIASHLSGNQMCKYQSKGLTLLAYTTPVQYNTENVENEKFFSEVSLPEPLGTTNDTLPGMRQPDERDRSLFPKGSSCDKSFGRGRRGKRETGNQCCDFDIYEVMRDVMTDLSTSPDFGPDQAGIIAERIKHVGQRRLAQTLEIIVSKSDFSIASHLSGNQICKYQDKGCTLMAYATPAQYNPLDVVTENFFSRVSIAEPLGTSQDTLLGMRQRKTGQRDRSMFPEGSDCSAQGRRVKRETGNRCCDFDIYEAMRDAMSDLSESPEFGTDKAGIVAERIKHVGQHRLGQSLEVIVSTGDFSVASHQAGNQICKYQTKGFTLLAYATPNQYDIQDKQMENFFSQVSKSEPLGTTETILTGVEELPTDEELERTGYPVGSHCDDGISHGSKCCDLGVYRAMKAAYDSWTADSKQDPYDLGQLAKMVRNKTEGKFDKSMEIVVSKGDFVSTGLRGDSPNACKFRVDKYYILCYVTPVPYPVAYTIDEDYLNFAYVTNPRRNTLSGIELNADGIEPTQNLCDGGANFEMHRAISYARDQRDFRRIQDIDLLARTVARNVERRFNSTFETVVSKTLFHHQGSNNKYIVCKIEEYGYHALVFEIYHTRSIYGEFRLIGDRDPPLRPFELVREVVDTVVNNQFRLPVQNFFQQTPLQQFQLTQQAINFQQANQFVVPQVQQPLVFVPPQVPPVAIVYPPIVPPTVSVPTCFAEDSWVTTPDGRRKIGDLEVGDYVLTANRTATFFAPVSMWIHREPEVEADFLTIMTEYGKTIRVTAKHFIFRNKCKKNHGSMVKSLPVDRAAVFAEDLKVGECVYVNYQKNFMQQKIARIQKSKRKGIYAPLVENGRILVNDILASCHSEIPQPQLQYLYFKFARNLKHAVSTTVATLQQQIPLPMMTDFMKEILKIVLPNAT